VVAHTGPRLARNAAAGSHRSKRVAQTPATPALLGPALTVSNDINASSNQLAARADSQP